MRKHLDRIRFRGQKRDEFLDLAESPNTSDTECTEESLIKPRGSVRDLEELREMDGEQQSDAQVGELESLHSRASTPEHRLCYKVIYSVVVLLLMNGNRLFVKDQNHCLLPEILRSAVFPLRLALYHFLHLFKMTPGQISARSKVT